MRTVLILSLAAGMLAGCGNKKSIADSFADPEIKLCAEYLDNVKFASQLDEETFSRVEGITRTVCLKVFEGEIKFRELARAQLVNYLDGYSDHTIENVSSNGFEYKGFSRRRLTGDIVFEDKNKNKNQKFLTYLNKSSLSWVVELSDPTNDMENSDTGIIGMWCNVRTYEDGRQVNVIEIESLAEENRPSVYPYEVRAFDDIAESKQTGYEADYIDGRIKLMGDRFKESSMEYEIDGNGFLHTISLGIESGVARPISKYDDPSECDKQ